MKAPTIKISTNYAEFKIIDVNREINKSHLKKLTESIRNRNLLHLFPIIVNSKMQVIEGQHRLKAAQALNFALYYIVDDQVDAKDIAIINNNRKGWSGKDYIAFYAKSGNVHYKKLQKLMTQYPKLTILSTIRLCDESKGNYYGGGDTTRHMREGLIEVPNIELAHILSELSLKMAKYYEYSFNGAFLLGMKNAITQSQMSPQIATEKIWKAKDVFPRVIDKRETCLSIFKSILYTVSTDLKKLPTA